jgi:hypothetical protein
MNQDMREKALQTGKRFSVAANPVAGSRGRNFFIINI